MSNLGTVAALGTTAFIRGKRRKCSPLSKGHDAPELFLVHRQDSPLLPAVRVRAEFQRGIPYFVVFWVYLPTLGET